MYSLIFNSYTDVKEAIVRVGKEAPAVVLLESCTFNSLADFRSVCKIFISCAISLCIDEMPLSRRQVAILRLNLKSLKGLTLSNINMSDACAKLLSSAEMPNLTDLYLDNVSCGSEKSLRLLFSRFPSQIASLKCANIPVAGAFCHMHTPELKHVVLKNCGLGHRGFESICAFLASTCTLLTALTFGSDSIISFTPLVDVVRANNCLKTLYLENLTSVSARGIDDMSIYSGGLCLRVELSQPLLSEITLRLRGVANVDLRSGFLPIVVPHSDIFRSIILLLNDARRLQLPTELIRIVAQMLLEDLA